MVNLNSTPDTELVERLRSGEDSALSAIYKKYWKSLFMSAYRLLKDKEACEDVVQDIFTRLWRRRENLEITTSLSAYLKTAARYEVYKQIRIGRGREDLFDELEERLYTPVFSTYASIEHKELINQVNTIVETLPEKCRGVYKLSREEHLSHKEIAARLNISTKTVENHLTKALKHLRTSLGDLLTIEMLIFLLNK